MKVLDLMTTNAKSCSPNANLSTAAGLMWDNDCGVIPVTDDAGRVVGLITDRDICMAVAMRNRLASEIPVSEVISGKVYACAPEDDIKEALQTMQREQVRRLPVVGKDGALQGIISISDIVLHTEPATGRQTPELSHQDAIVTLKEIRGEQGLQSSAKN